MRLVFFLIWKILNLTLLNLVRLNSSSNFTLIIRTNNLVSLFQQFFALVIKGSRYFLIGWPSKFIIRKHNSKNYPQKCLVESHEKFIICIKCGTLIGNTSRAISDAKNYELPSNGTVRTWRRTVAFAKKRMMELSHHREWNKTATLW